MMKQIFPLASPAQVPRDQQQVFTEKAMDLLSPLSLLLVSLHNKSKSWIDALEDCQRDHFSLVEICEKKVRDDVKRLQNKTDSKTGVWIGLQRSIFGYRPEWKWISGYNVVKSQLNRTSSTNSDFDNHCGKVIFDNKTEEIKWSNADCHEKLPYICQRMNEKPCTDEYTEKSELFIDID
ncbi:regenerating islet-derived protein 3-gamma isoform X1 [Maylandia zebra]|uniref:regenerating islet-derived protein 3-gamma isoform X1 n=1 Tax=Maylandia zebra TaxID=106582 RepID=UPI00403D2A99